MEDMHSTQVFIIECNTFDFELLPDIMESLSRFMGKAVPEGASFVMDDMSTALFETSLLRKVILCATFDKKIYGENFVLDFAINYVDDEKSISGKVYREFDLLQSIDPLQWKIYQMLK